MFRSVALKRGVLSVYLYNLGLGTGKRSHFQWIDLYPPLFFSNSNLNPTKNSGPVIIHAEQCKKYGMSLSSGPLHSWSRALGLNGGFFTLTPSGSRLWRFGWGFLPGLPCFVSHNCLYDTLS